MNTNNVVWKDKEFIHTFLKDIRGAIPLAQEQLEIIVHIVKSLDKPVRNFLDVGCGNGILGALILSNFPESTGVLLDFSEPMLKEARQSLSPLSERVTFLKTDYEDKNWRRDTLEYGPFDLVVSGYSIHHQTDENKRRIYRDIFSLLRPRGFFLNLEHVASKSHWIESLSDELIIDSLYKYSIGNNSEKTRDQIAHDFLNRPDKKENILAYVEDQCEWLRAIGFEEVDCFFKVFELALFGGRRP